MTTIPARLPNTATAEAPAVLMGYQQRWVADKSPLKVIEKSRRTGLTWGEAADDVLTAASNRSAGGQNVYYIAYNQDMTIEYIQACAMWARAFNHAASEIEEGFWEDDDADKNIKTFTIRFPASGFRIVALTSRPSNLRGRQGTIVIDEAAFHDQLDELLKAALAMLIWGGRVRVISTHNGVENPFNELVEDIRAGKRKGTVHRVTFQEAVADGLYRRVCLRLPLPQRGHARAAVRGHHEVEREPLSVRQRMGEVLRRLGDGSFHRFEGLFDVVLAGDTALAGRKLMGKDAELNRYSDELQDLLVVLAVVLTLRPGVGLHVAVDAQSGQADQLGQLPLRKPRHTDGFVVEFHEGS